MTQAAQQGRNSLPEPPVGEFVFSVPSGRITWSDRLRDTFGFGPGEVVPTLQLLTAHQDPADLEAWNSALRQVLSEGRRAGLLHRIVDVNGKQHILHTLLTAELDEKAAVTAVTGVVTELTGEWRRHQAREVDRAVAASARTRSVIDQAKGILMAVLSITDDQAFSLLRWHSSNRNVKLNQVAETIVDRLSAATTATEAPRQRLAAVLADIGTAPRTAERTGRNPIDLVTAPASETSTLAAARRRIPAAVLPDTMVQAVAAAAQSITIVDYRLPDQPLVYVNPAFERTTGYPAAEVLGRNCRLLQGPGSDRAQAAAIREALASGDSIRTVLLNYRKDGTPFWNELLLAPVRDGHQQITHYVGYQTDVSERVEREQQLERLAYQDPTTGLPNHAAALRHLTAASSGQTPFRLLYISVGRFRAAADNDSIDMAGILALAAQRLRTLLPPETFVARTDDGFLLVLEEVAEFKTWGVAAAAAIFEQPFATPAGDVALDVRVGQAEYPLDADDPHILLNIARPATRHPAPTS